MERLRNGRRGVVCAGMCAVLLSTACDGVLDKSDELSSASPSPAIPPPPPLPSLFGPSLLWVSGTVTDSSGNPVVGASVTGYGATDEVRRQCAFASGELEASTGSDGQYVARWHRRPGGTFGGCLFLTVTPPESSGLGTVSIDSLRVTFYDVNDPALKTDTLEVNVVLPSGSDS